MTFTQEKPEQLRQQFATCDGGTMVTPEFRRIAEKIFTEGGHRQAPYVGFPTLLNALARNSDLCELDLSGLQVAPQPVRPQAVP